MTKLNVCAHGHIMRVFNAEVAATGNPRVDQLLRTLFADRERCRECVRVRARKSDMKRARRSLMPVVNHNRLFGAQPQFFSAQKEPTL